MTAPARVSVAVVAQALGLDLILPGSVGGSPATVLGAQMVTATDEVLGDAGVADVLVVLDWAPLHRGGPLPALAPLLDGALTTYRPVAVAVVCHGRTINPPEAVLEQLIRAGVALLWGGPSLRAEAVVERVSELVLGPAPTTPLGLDELLREGADLVGLVGRVARRIDAQVRILQGTQLVLVDPADPADGAPTSVGSSSRPAVVADLALSHAGRDIGRVVVTRERLLSVEDQALLGAIAPVLALGLVAHGADEVRASPARELLAAVIGDDLIAREAALRRNRRLQVFPRRWSVVVVVEPFGAPLSRGGLERLGRHLSMPLRAEDDRATLVVHESSVVILVGADVPLDRLLRGLRRRAALPLAVGTSRRVEDSRSFPGAYRQAQRAATLGRRLRHVNQVTVYEELGVLRLLFQLPEHERRSFAREVLGPLVEDPSEPDAAALRDVLHALRASHGNITEAARRLFIHPNTLRHRVARIESLIGPFLSDADRRMTVFLALDLHRLDGDEVR